MSGSGSSIELPNGWVLYKGECGICSRWLRFWQPTLASIRERRCTGSLILKPDSPEYISGTLNGWLARFTTS
jgi:hypothetical protein